MEYGIRRWQSFGRQSSNGLTKSNDTMVWRFPRYENEKSSTAHNESCASPGCRLREHGDRLPDVLSSGQHSAHDKNNLPILSIIMGWKYGFHSHSKAEVYFVQHPRNFTNLSGGQRTRSY